MKIQLIHPSEKPTGMVEGAWYVPMNLLSLATCLNIHGHQVEILDGQLMGTEKIAPKINADIVGFDLMHSSIKSFDALSGVAKKQGATTVVGGHLATHLAREILQENQNIDYVCMLGGEEALLSLTQGKIHPNLAYRNVLSKEFLVPKWQNLRPVDIRRTPIPDRKIKGVDLEKHIDLFRSDVRNSRLKLPYGRVTNTYFCRGCPYRIRERGCSFCSRSDTKLSCRSAEQAWKEANQLAENFSIECIADFSDTFSPLLKPLGEYVESYGRPWKFLRIYVAVNEIALPGVIPLLKRLGVTTVLLGIESGSEEVLRLNVAPQKVHTPKKVMAVCRALAEAGIMISPAYVLGMRGEKTESLEATLKLNQRLQKIGNTEITYSNVLTPFPGTKAFRDLLSLPGLKDKFGGTYRLTPKELEKDYIERFTSVSYKQVQETRISLADDSAISSFEFVPP